MPKPVHVICSESGAQDKDTGLVSLFNLIEKLNITKVNPDTTGRVIVQGVSLRVTATWMQDEGDVGKLYEYEASIFLPPNNVELPLASGEFVFHRPFHRLIAKLSGIIPFEGGGVLRVVNRVRRKGSEEWISQECPILIEVVEPVTAQEPLSPGKSQT